jgi:hypothetical protein
MGHGRPADIAILIYVTFFSIENIITIDKLRIFYASELSYSLKASFHVSPLFQSQKDLFRRCSDAVSSQTLTFNFRIQTAGQLDYACRFS